jgi:tetratricopeptide (TPR) repeat protein
LHIAYIPQELGQLALWEGDWEEASRSLKQSLALADEMGHPESQYITQMCLAELDVLLGRPEEAIQRLEPLAAEENVRPGLLPPLAWAHLCIDDDRHLQQAEGIAERAASRGRKQPGYLADALWVQGMVLIRQGRDEEATSVLAEGLALARSMPFPYMEARVLEQMGILQQQRADPEQAQARLEEALAIFQRLGAKKDVERTEQALAALDRTTDTAS